MASIELQVNGKTLVFTGDSVSYSGHVLHYSQMSNIAHRDGGQPAFIFNYNGKRLALPYDPKDKDTVLKIFQRIAALNQKRKTQPAAPEPQTEEQVVTTPAAMQTPDYERPPQNTDDRQDAKDNKRMKICKACGKEIAKSVIACPYCGVRIKKPIYKRWWFIAVIAIIIIVAIIQAAGGDTKVKSTGPSTGTTEASKNETSNKPKTKTYSDGTYKIGTDMPAGEYLIEGSGYMQLTKDSTGTLDSIITNDNFINRTYIKVKKGQYLTFNGTAYRSKDAPKYDSKKVSDGMYKVGKDIPAGEYKVTANGDAYIQVSSDATGTLDSIVTNDNFSSSKYVTVEKGQFLKLVNCSIKVQ